MLQVVEDTTRNRTLLRYIWQICIAAPLTQWFKLGYFAIWYEAVTRKDIEEEDLDADAYDEAPEDNIRQRIIRYMLDNRGNIKKRNRPAVLRTRYYTSYSDPESYYYSLLVIHVRLVLNEVCP